MAATAILLFVADLIEHRLGLEDALREAAERYGKTGPEEGIETEIAKTEKARGVHQRRGSGAKSNTWSEN